MSATPLITTQVEAPRYAVTLRRLVDLEPVQYLAWFESLSWMRKTDGAGNFTLQVNIDHIENDAVLHPVRHEVQETVIEIRRNGEFEFAGVFDTVQPDEATGMLTIQGLDLLSYLLSSRDIVPAAGEDYDEQESVPAETAILHFVREHLGSGASTERDLNDFLDGVTFQVGSSQGRGTTVTLRARYLSLLTAVGSLARQGGLIVSMGFQSNYTGYQLEVREPVDHTAGNDDAVTFGVRAGTALNVQPNYTRRRRSNAMVGLGQGSGVYRTVVVREDDDDLATHSRREITQDERSQATTAELELTENAADGDTVTIGSKVYTYQDTLSDSDGNVLVGGDREESLANLRAAINLGEGSGTLYAASTTANDAAWGASAQSGALVVSATGAVDEVDLEETLSAGSWDRSSIDLSGMQGALDARLERQEIESRSYRVQPDPAGAPYREAWDLGDDVTVRSDLFGISDDLRITEVKVALNVNRYEDVQISVGEPPETLTQLVAGAVSQANNVLRS